jgi:hypothetical protein
MHLEAVETASGIFNEWLNTMINHGVRSKWS